MHGPEGSDVYGQDYDYAADGIGFLEQAVRVLRITAWTFAALLLVGVVHTWSFADALTDEAIEKVVRVERAVALLTVAHGIPDFLDTVSLAHPLGCEEWVAQKTFERESWRVRCLPLRKVAR